MSIPIKRSSISNSKTIFIDKNAWHWTNYYDTWMQEISFADCLSTCPAQRRIRISWLHSLTSRWAFLTKMCEMRHSHLCVTLYDPMFDSVWEYVCSASNGQCEIKTKIWIFARANDHTSKLAYTITHYNDMRCGHLKIAWNHTQTQQSMLHAKRFVVRQINKCHRIIVQPENWSTSLPYCLFAIRFCAAKLTNQMKSKNTSPSRKFKPIEKYHQSNCCHESVQFGLYVPTVYSLPIPDK